MAFQISNRNDNFRKPRRFAPYRLLFGELLRLLPTVIYPMNFYREVLLPTVVSPVNIYRENAFHLAPFVI